MDKKVESLLASVKQSPQYALICDETLLRVCETMAPRYSREKEAVKAVKAHLHSICGAFLTRSDWIKAQELISKAPENLRDGSLQAHIDIMKLHASTAERLLLLPGFYTDLFKAVGVPRSIADIGCGFNPFTIPFMGLGDGFQYRATDINLQSLGLVGEYFKLISGSLKADVQSEACDLLSRIPEWPLCDIAFVFKLLPLMEQQKHGGARMLLDKLNTKIIAVTFPTVTLGGKRKGMSRYYTDYFEKLIADDYAILYRNEYANELIFAIKRLK